MVIYITKMNLYEQKYTSKSKLNNELKGEFWKLNPGDFWKYFLRGLKTNNIIIVLGSDFGQKWF